MENLYKKVGINSRVSSISTFSKIHFDKQKARKINSLSRVEGAWITCNLAIIHKKEKYPKSHFTRKIYVAIIRLTTKEVMTLDVIEIASKLTLYGLVICATVQDFAYMKIRNRLILCGLFSALLFHVLGNGVSGLVQVLLNIFFPVVVLYLLYLMRVLGAGDIKLFSVIGGFINFKELVWCIVSAFLIGALFSVCKMLNSKTLIPKLYRSGNYLIQLARGNFSEYQTEDGKDSRIHFALCILLALITTQVFFCYS